MALTVPIRHCQRYLYIIIKATDMPTITIHTWGSKSHDGLGYAWDLNWDIKTKAEARWKYQEYLDKIACYDGVLETCELMEKMAEQDGFTLHKQHKLNQDRLKLRVPFATPIPMDLSAPSAAWGKKWNVHTVEQARRLYSTYFNRRRSLMRVIERKERMEGLAVEDGFSLFSTQTNKKKTRK